MKEIADFHDDINEVFQLRNLVVHNDGVVNSLFIHNLSETIATKYKIGEQVSFKEREIEEYIERIEICFLLISLEIWHKVDKVCDERAELIFEIAFDHMNEGRFNIASFLFNKMHQESCTELIKIASKINYWHCQKKLKGLGSIRNDVESLDFSAMSDKFKAGKMALLNEIDDLLLIFDDVVKKEQISIEEFKTWPIFEDCRSDIRFKTKLEIMEKNTVEVGFETLGPQKKTIAHKKSSKKVTKKA